MRSVLILASLITTIPLVAQAQAPATATADDKGFGVKSDDGSFEFRLHGLLQADARTFVGDDASAGLHDTFLFRRVEPVFEFTLGKLAFFKVQPQFAGDAASTSDVYAELRLHPRLGVRAGKFKEPLSLENLQGGGAIVFTERGFPSELSAGRDFGLQFQGELFSGTTSYAVGYFNGAPDGRDAVSSDTDNRKEAAARLFIEPFRNGDGFLHGLGFGVAGSVGTKLTALKGNLTGDTANYNNSLPRYRSPGQNTIFSYKIVTTGVPTAADTVVANGDHTRLTPQLYFYRGSFGALAEWIGSEQDVALGGVTQSFRHSAWQGVLSYVLTGEPAGYKGVGKPTAPYVPEGEGWGAFEIGARYGVLDIDDDAFTQGFADPAKSVTEARSAGIVANWYLTGNVRVTLDYSATGFTGGAATGDRDREQAVFARLQLSF